jgi:hypothetical protein
LVGWQFRHIFLLPIVLMLFRFAWLCIFKMNNCI